MTIEQWWPRLKPSTQQWLIGNNGDAVPPEVANEIAAVDGPGPDDAWWAGRDEPQALYFPDEAIDWVEAVANGETP